MYYVIFEDGCVYEHRREDTAKGMQNHNSDVKSIVVSKKIYKAIFKNRFTD